MPSDFYRRTKAVMVVAFAVIVSCLVLVEVVEVAQSAKTQRAIKNIEQNALISAELVHRIGDDIHDERLLLDRHVLEHESSRMGLAEQQIERLRADYEDAARSYEALPAQPVEVAAWRALTSDVAKARLLITPVLELSRQDRVDDAARALAKLDPIYENIGQHERTLDQINQSEANASMAEVHQVRASSLEVRLVLLAAVVLTIVLIGVWSTRSALGVQRELAKANQSLADRNRDLDAFAGRLAHDLRGPLNTISLSSNILAQRFPDAGSTTAIMERSITQITNLMEELLTLSRLGALPNATVQVESVAAVVTQRLEPIVTGAGGALRVDLQAAEIACSESLLAQVLWNLGENAVKYRRPDLAPAIAIEGRVAEGRYLIRVTDNGMGMTDADASHVFEPFYRGERTGKIAGTGLGLSIVRRIIDASKGTIAIASRLSEGTTFDVSLPLARAM